MIAEEEIRFAEAKKMRGAKLVVLEIPLLFEVGAEKRCDKVVVVSAPYFIQRHRVLKRGGMTEQKFHDILKLQIPDREKKARADVVIPTGFGKFYSYWCVSRLVEQLRNAA